MFSVTVEARWGILRLKFFCLYWKCLLRSCLICYFPLLHIYKAKYRHKKHHANIAYHRKFEPCNLFSSKYMRGTYKVTYVLVPLLCNIKRTTVLRSSYVGKNLDCRCSLFFCNHACLSRPGACRVVDLRSDTTTARPAINSAPQYVLTSSHPPYLCLLFLPAETRMGEKIWNEGLLFVSQLPVVERMTPKTLTYFGLSWQQGNHDFGNSASAIGGSTGFLLVETVQTLFKVWQIQSRTCLYQNG